MQKKTKLKTKRTFNEAKKVNTASKTVPIKIDDLDCIIDPNTGKCIEIIDIGGGSGSANEAGSTAGSLSVSLTGAASYSTPIMVPPGIKDVAPNIAISYTSQGSNGLAGWGWNVSGLSTISRIPATKYYDNRHDGIDFKDDRFSLDGQRLIIKSGSYGANGSTYQTENYSNVKVVAYGTSPYGSSYGPSYFIVYYPNGVRAWYGNSGNSRNRLEWAIFRWQDPQGNYVDYNYQSDNGLLSIKTIKFGGRLGSTSPINQINFTYTSRARPEIVYVGGYSFKRTNLLKSIQVTASGSQYRKYELAHNSTSLGYQRLASIKEYNSKYKALRPITFEYDNTSSWIPERVETPDLYPGFDYENSDLIAGDFSGDGRTDVIFYNKNQKNDIYLHYDLYNQYGSFAYKILTGGFSDIFSSSILTHNNKLLSQQAITTVKETSSSSSTTSNVRFRTYAMAPSGVYIQYDKNWSAPKYQSDNYSGGSSYYQIPKKYISGDFNGDGLTDVIAIEKQYSRRTCYPVECEGDGDFLLRKSTSKEVDSISKSQNKSVRIDPIRLDFDCYDCTSYSVNQYNAKAHFIDLKRDLTSNFSKSAGYFRKSIGSSDLVQVGDHNGEGRQDIYHFKEGKLYIYTLDDTNNLKLLHEESDSGIKLKIGYHQTPILLGDYNGDGKTDFLIATANKSTNWKYFISKGKEFYKPTKSLPFAYYQYEEKTEGNWKTGLKKAFYEYRYISQDVNGDGKTDIIMHNVNTKENYSNGEKLSAVEYISIYKNNQSTSSDVASFSYEAGYSDTSGDVGKYGSPIFLESNQTNGNLEYGYISARNIFMYEFKKDHRKDITLKTVSNNGIKTTIDYANLGTPDNQFGYQTYTADYSLNYPYINVNRANSLQLVKKLTEEGSGIKRYQDFIYQGAVSNINIGFQGFLKTKRSNWYGNGVGTLWTISKHDITKKGAVIEQLISTSQYEGNSYVSKTTNTFSTNTAANKVFTNIPIKVVQHNALDGTTTTKNYTYDSYKPEFD